MMEIVSLSLLWFEEKCKIRLFDILEADFEHKVHCIWGSLWGQVSLGQSHMPPKPKIAVGSIQSSFSIDGSIATAVCSVWLKVCRVDRI